MKKFLSILPLLLASHTVTAQEVKGALTTNGVTKALTHVSAHEVEDPKSKDVSVVIVLSDRALTREQATSESKLQDLMKARKLTALRIVLDANCKVMSAAPYSPAMRNFVSSGAYIHWTPTTYDDTAVAGHVKSWDDAELAGERWSYDIVFVTPITLAPGSDPPTKTKSTTAMKLPVVEPPPAKAKTTAPAPAPTSPPPKPGVPTDGPGVILSLVRGTGVQQTQITVSVRGPFVRDDMGPQATTITDTASGDMMSLMHELKMASRSSGAAIKEQMEKTKAANPGAFAEPPPPVNTGRTENIGAQECTVYTLTAGETTSTFWVAADHPFFALLKDDLPALEKSGAAVLTLKGVPGLVIQSSTKLGNDVNYTMLTDVRRATLKASLFKEPPDYKSAP